MDLSQKKLTKSEWSSVEIPVAEQEKRVLQLILDGYSNPDIKKNAHLSLIGYTKMDPNPEMEYYLFRHYFQSVMEQIAAPKYKTAIQTWLKKIQTKKTRNPNKADMIRLGRVDQIIQSQRDMLFEFLLLDTAAQWIQTESPTYLYQLVQFRPASISHVNPYVTEYIDLILETADPKSPELIRATFQQSATILEKTPRLIQYQDEMLYSHQSDLFRVFRGSVKPKLVLYMAPTGTGKTLSPIGISHQYRVIFVCVARHVGLALAKSAISMGKKVAFAFGCETSSDIRLHYFAAADYSVNRRSGGIGKVDNSNGSKVEIMICDVASYPVAMYYMKAFHSLRETVLYWDEPTISLDQETHELHGLIQKVWTKNQVPNIVLSCATLPKRDEIGPLIHSYKDMFPGGDVHTIESFDCKKTISLLNKNSQIVLPHLIFAEYRHVMDCVDHCNSCRSLLRYFDVSEIIRFLCYVKGDPAEKFRHVGEINLLSIKLYYLDVLRNLDAEKWPAIHQAMVSTLPSRFSLEKEGLKKMYSVSSSSTTSFAMSRTVSVDAPIKPNPGFQGILLTTTDAHTLTDGPTLYLAEDVKKIGRFFIQQSNIPDQIFQAILEKIERNNAINKQADALQKEFEDKDTSGPKEDDKKKAEKDTTTKEQQRLLDKIAELRERLYSVQMNSAYIPNTKAHQDIWIPRDCKHVANAFVPHVSEADVKEIMGLGKVDNQQKLLLIMGIGVFSLDADIAYMEIMKRLAYQQQLFLIIASSDYIYGTNYQFCHGFVGKDLANMTQQKTIQAIGRVGRNNIQQEYTVRFRDDEVIQRLFKRAERNMEAENMCRLFCLEEED